MKLTNIIITIFLAYIAYQNYRIHKDKLKLDLFEKRYRVFDAIKKFVSSFCINGKVSRKELSELNMISSDVVFLFDEDVDSFFKLIREKGLSHIHNLEKLDNHSLTSEERKRIAEALEVEETWFSNQIEGLRDVFKKYLRFIN